MDIDTSPVKRFDAKKNCLRERGYPSLMIVPIEYRSTQDFNSRVPKSRLSVEDTLSEF